MVLGGRGFFQVRYPCTVRTQSWTGPPRAGEGGEEVIYVDIRHEPIIQMYTGLYPRAEAAGCWAEECAAECE